MMGLLLRVGVDTGTGGALGPIFDDGSFEFIPIPERYPSKGVKTYKNTMGRRGDPLSTYVPKALENTAMHVDPEFDTYTYGDSTPIKRWSLLKLRPDDLLVFYVGLQPFNTDRYQTALYSSGFFTVQKVVDFNHLPRADIERCCKLYANNAHVKRGPPFDDLVIVAGNTHSSKLLDKAILLSQKRPDRRKRLMHAVSDEMEQLLGITGFIQRSAPRRIEEKYINNLSGLFRV
jgi:hypothetical protein